MKDNQIGDGIQRKKQREYGHIKDLYCVYCKDTTKNIEVRFCDFYSELAEEAKRLHKEYYENNNEAFVIHHELHFI
jgi:hypothetical protein